MIKKLISKFYKTIEDFSFIFIMVIMFLFSLILFKSLAYADCFESCYSISIEANNFLTGSLENQLIIVEMVFNN